MERMLKKCAAALAIAAAVCAVAPATGGRSADAAHAEPKVLHAFLSTGETALDPAVASDVATLSLLENLFDPLLRYDYTARPVKLIPNTLAAMPEVTDGGKTYTFRLRQDVYFTPDAAVKSRRQVTAADYVYSFKRLYDPALKSPWLYLFDGVVEMQAVDPFTLRIRLKAPDPNFLFYLAMPATGVVAREVVEA